MKDSRDLENRVLKKGPPGSSPDRMRDAGDYWWMGVGILVLIFFAMCLVKLGTVWF